MAALRLGTRAAVRLGDADDVPTGDRVVTIHPTAPVDASDVESDAFLAAARAALERDGFVHLRRLIPDADVSAARATVLADLDRRGGVLERDSDALLPDCGIACVPFLEGRNAVTHDAAVLGVLEHPRLRRFFQRLFGGDDAPRTLDYKWLRGVPRGVATGAHVDRVYMGRGSAKMLTSWLPLGAAPLELGGLAMLARSHDAAGPLAELHATYGAMDTERDGLDGTGWFTSDPCELLDRFAHAPPCVWRAADYAPGDAVVFGLGLVHMSTANLTDRVRLSADVRWLPSSEPVDPRYIGDVDVADRVVSGARKADADPANPPPPKKARAGDAVTIDDMKRRWGFAPYEAPG